VRRGGTFALSAAKEITMNNHHLAPIDLGPVVELTRGAGPSPQMDIVSYYDVAD
jgi:hypothetical protein